MASTAADFLRRAESLILDRYRYYFIDLSRTGVSLRHPRPSKAELEALSRREDALVVEEQHHTDLI
jgi:hypothetical protein